MSIVTKKGLVDDLSRVYELKTFLLPGYESSLVGKVYSQGKFATVSSIEVSDMYLNQDFGRALLVSFIEYCKVVGITRLDVNIDSIELFNLMKELFLDKVKFTKRFANGKVDEDPSTSHMHFIFENNKKITAQNGTPASCIEASVDLND